MRSTPRVSCVGSRIRCASIRRPPNCFATQQPSSSRCSGRSFAPPPPSRTESPPRSSTTSTGSAMGSTGVGIAASSVFTPALGAGSPTPPRLVPRPHLRSSSERGHNALIRTRMSLFSWRTNYRIVYLDLLKFLHNRPAPKAADEPSSLLDVVARPYCTTLLVQHLRDDFPLGRMPELHHTIIIQNSISATGGGDRAGIPRHRALCGRIWGPFTQEEMERICRGVLFFPLDRRLAQVRAGPPSEETGLPTSIQSRRGFARAVC
ncbi:hypothetical protein B0H12DRAFT_617984 [Mycena haematopus]|nr:hypothetical protein B0H12DRAFT_617984 [Mycena haematopus]